MSKNQRIYPVVYKILNVVTGDFYIGGSTKYFGRRRNHITQLNRGVHHTLKLQAAWSEYGQSALEFVILEELTDPSIIKEREQLYIKTLLPTYNTVLDSTTKGFRHRPDSIEKMRLRVFTESHRHEQSLRMKNMSPETRQRMSEAQRRRAERGDFKRGFFKDTARPVYQFTSEGQFIKKWKSAAFAENQLAGVRASNINSCCNRQRASHAGFIWLYNQEEIKDAVNVINNPKANPNIRPISQYTKDGQLVRTYNSTSEVKQYGFGASDVTNCVRQRPGYKTHKGYIWKYAA